MGSENTLCVMIVNPFLHFTLTFLYLCSIEIEEWFHILHQTLVQFGSDYEGDCSLREIFRVICHFSLGTPLRIVLS